MASWTTIPTSVLDVGKPVRSIDIIALRDNITAVTEGAAGAPKVQTAGITDGSITTAKIAEGNVTTGDIADGNVTEGKLGASSVAQAKLKTTTASGSSGNIGTTGGFNYSLTGGTYSWWTASSTSGEGTALFSFGGGTDTAAGVIGVTNIAPNGATFHLDERYVQGSPPYNLGHGDIPLFIFAMMNVDGSIRSVSVAPDPTWAYHGPTNICPERIDFKTGKGFRRYQEVDGVSLVALRKDAGRFARFLRGDAEVKMVEREITHAIKNADMDLHPHPWCASPLPEGCSVVMLDPLAPLVSRLADLVETAGAKEARLVIEENVRIQNQPLAMTSPRGIVVVRGSLR